ncbi:DNA primase [Patescibacteria group bacterium]|nr:DNA primase [Patescibacteria group bacterium]
MADQIEEVKGKTDIVSLIGEYIEIKKAGRNFKAVCPFHSEKTPSFMISPELQIYKCFGCQEKGDVFAFLQAYEGMEFGEALKFLADRAGVKLQSISRTDTSEKEKIIEINNLTSRFYQYLLFNSSFGKIALNYLLKERGLKPTTIKEFGLGFSPDSPLALKKFLIEKKKFDPRDIEKAGIGYPKGGYFIDRLRGRVIFPLLDHRGNTVGFAGRVLPGPNENETAKYINTPETPVYHKGNLLYGLNLTRGNIKKKDIAIVVEGELDAISSWQAGVKNVVAIKGSAITEDQVRLLSRFCKKVILCLDSDIAGDAAARRGVITAQDQGLEVKVARLKEYKDPDDAARKNPGGYKESLINAVGIWDFLIDSVFERFNAKSGEGKAKISKEVVPVLSLISDKIVQDHYVNLVAKRLDVSNEAVLEQIQKQGKKEEKDEGSKVPFSERKERRELLEERLLSLGFRYDPEILLKKTVSDLVKTPLSKRILDEYLTYSQKNTKFNLSKFGESLPKELFDGFAWMVLSEELEIGGPDEIPIETGAVLHGLKILSLKEKLLGLSENIKKFEGEEEKEKLLKVKEEFKNLTEKLHSLEEKAKQGIILDDDA